MFSLTTHFNKCLNDVIWFWLLPSVLGIPCQCRCFSYLPALLQSGPQQSEFWAMRVGLMAGIVGCDFELLVPEQNKLPRFARLVYFHLHLTDNPISEAGGEPYQFIARYALFFKWICVEIFGKLDANLRMCMWLSVLPWLCLLPRLRSCCWLGAHFSWWSSSAFLIPDSDIFRCLANLFCLSMTSLISSNIEHSHISLKEKHHSRQQDTSLALIVR